MAKKIEPTSHAKFDIGQEVETRGLNPKRGRICKVDYLGAGIWWYQMDTLLVWLRESQLKSCSVLDLLAEIE